MNLRITRDLKNCFISQVKQPVTKMHGKKLVKMSNPQNKILLAYKYPSLFGSQNQESNTCKQAFGTNNKTKDIEDPFINTQIDLDSKKDEQQLPSPKVIIKPEVMTDFQTMDLASPSINFETYLQMELGNAKAMREKQIENID